MLDKYYINRAYGIIVDFFYQALSTFLLILDLFEHIFEHINAPLSGLYYNIEKYRSED